MLFSRQKKLQRDRDAGLVFCWRGGQGGNPGGLVLAILMTLGIFSAAFLGLSLSFKGTRPESKQSAKILLLDEISSEMALWIDQNTPFPSRWDPLTDSEHQQRVDEQLRLALQQLSPPDSPWREMPELENNLYTPRLIEAGAVQLGNLPKPISVPSIQGVYELIITLNAGGDFRERLPSEVDDFEIAIPMQEYGSSLRFAVSLNANGEVVHCLPVEWELSEYAKGIENWVRRQKFEPSAGVEDQVGEVIVRVEVKNHAGN